MLFSSHDVTFDNVVVRNPVSVTALRGFAFWRRVNPPALQQYIYTAIGSIGGLEFQ